MADDILMSIEGRLQQLGDALQVLVRDYAPVHLKGAIEVQTFVAPTRVTISIRVQAGQQPVQKYGTEDAAAQEFGSGPRSTKGSEWNGIIVPVNRTYLVFEDTNEYEGQIIHTKLVHSPGINPYQGRGYVRPAIEEFKSTVLPSIDPDIRQAVNIAIRKSFPGAGKK